MPARKSRGRPTGETGQWKPAFLQALTLIPVITSAAKAANVSRTAAYDAKKSDAEFAADWEESLAVGKDRIKIEMWRRGIIGVLEPIYQGGKEIGEIRKYSDRMLELLAKGLFPSEFRERASVEHSGPEGGPIEYVADSAKDELRDRISGIAERIAAGDVDPKLN